MSAPNGPAYAPGDVVYRWWERGSVNGSPSVQPLKVLRVNRLTLTVLTEQGHTFRLPHADVAGRYTEGGVTFPESGRAL